MTTPRRFRRVRGLLSRQALATDCGIAAALTAGGLAGVWALSGFLTVPTWVAVTLTVLLHAPLALRRRYPLTVLLVHTAAFVTYGLVMVPEGLFSTMALFVAVYSAGAYGASHRRDWTRGASITILSFQLVWVLLTLDPVEIDSDVPVDPVAFSVFTVLLNVVFFVAAWVLGDAMRERREAQAELAERAAQLEAERAENARRAVLAERVRIARELHDVVAHHVSVMGLQAGAARRVIERDPLEAAEALASIESSSREAVAELQRLLGFLRSHDDPEAGDLRAPQPGLGALEPLIEQMRDGPVEVRLSVEGEPGATPPGVELSVYRIVQEALTNTLKHANAGWAEVLVHHAPDALLVEVVDDGATTSAPGVEGRGHGLLGMRERVALHEGEFEAGPRPAGGFAVRARFPLAGRRAAASEA